MRGKSRESQRNSAPESGASLVEFAILAPLLILLVFGIFTVARAFNVQNTLEHATREAARLGAVDPTMAHIVDAARGEVEAASIPWSSVSYCVVDMDDGNPGPSAVEPPGSKTLPCITVANGAGANDPTSGARIQVLLEIPNYKLNFLLFDIDVDLVATAVSRLEPGT